jgi:hypothetical protein
MSNYKKTLWVPFCTHTIVSFANSWSASFSTNRCPLMLCRLLESNSKWLVSCNICKFKKHLACCSSKLKWPFPIQVLFCNMKLLVEFFNKWICANLMEQVPLTLKRCKKQKHYPRITKYAFFKFLVFKIYNFCSVFWSPIWSLWFF